MRSPGYSLLEAMMTIAILLIVASMATPAFLAARDDARARSAADHVASLLHLARTDALKRHVNVALRFEPEGSDFRYAMYADGNGNGVRTIDIEEGADPVIRPAEAIAQQCAGVRFALDEEASPIDSDDSTATGPIRVGRSRMVSFSPLGASTSGTVYLLGRGRRQFAVRVLGPTGRIRLFEYNFGAAEWQAR